MKTQKDTLRAVIPYEYFEIDALEGWLDEKAREGWMLREMGSTFATFKRGEPARTRYRIDVCTREKEGKAKELREEYAQYGWTYVGARNWHFPIFKTEDKAAPELHTDEGMLRYSMGGIKAGQIFSVVSALLFCGWYLWKTSALTRGFVAGHGGGLSFLLHGNANLVLAITLLALNGILSLAGHITHYLAYMKREKAGLLLQRSYHTPRRAKARVLLQVGGTAVLVVSVLLALSVFAAV